MTIYRTEYDGYYVVRDRKGRIVAYEGYALCPRMIQKMIDNGEVITKDCFYYELISYGMCMDCTKGVKS